MGAQIVGDIWLSHLVMPGMPGESIALALLRTQALTFSKLGHLIAMNDEFPRKRIQQEVPLGKVPRCYARCIRCGCVAWLNDWVKAAAMGEYELADQIDRFIQSGNESRVDFLKECSGERYIARLIADADYEMEGES